MFSNVGSGIASSLNTTDDTNFIETLSQTAFSFKFGNIDFEFVLKELSTICCTKAIGLDDLHPRFMKLGAPFISQPLTYI